MNKLTHHLDSYLEGSSDKHGLNTVDIWERDAILENEAHHRHQDSWIIYIHGGAWRDPAIDSRSFLPALEILAASPNLLHMKGFASINYRLSPYPSHPTNPSAEDDPARNVKHPAHLDDVNTALGYLDRKYGGLGKFTLVGHSCGATLALSRSEDPIPYRLIGVEGIYDIELFVKSHADIPVYKEIVINAFGEDREVWLGASPTHVVEKLRSRVVVLAHSDTDELVEKAQLKIMLERLNASSRAVHKEQVVRSIQAEGTHDEIWSQGVELARIIEEAILIVG